MFTSKKGLCIMKITIYDEEIRVIVAEKFSGILDLKIKPEDLKIETMFDSLKEENIFIGFSADVKEK